MMLFLFVSLWVHIELKDKAEGKENLINRLSDELFKEQRKMIVSVNNII